jgi:hypothetical protein
MSPVDRRIRVHDDATVVVREVPRIISDDDLASERDSAHDAECHDCAKSAHHVPAKPVGPR